MYQRYNLEPVRFTLSLFTRATRQREDAWRNLGLIPDSKLSKAQRKLESSDFVHGRSRQCRNYHAALAPILESFHRFQMSDEAVYLKLGSKVKFVRLRCPLMFVIGDGLSGDGLTCRVKSYKHGLISRHCACPYAELASQNHDCNWKNCSVIERYVEAAMPPVDAVLERLRPGHLEQNQALPENKEDISPESAAIWLRQHSQYVCRNAFRSIDFCCGPENGIIMSTPTDMMHAFLLGIVKYSVTVFLSQYSHNQRGRIDALVNRCLSKHKSRLKAHYPKVNFQNGITNLKLLTAKEWFGVAFTLLIVSRLEEGQAILGKRLAAETGLANDDADEINPHLQYDTSEDDGLTDEEDGFGNLSDTHGGRDAPKLASPCTLAQFVKLLETLLTFYQWAKCYVIVLPELPATLSQDPPRQIERLKDGIDRVLRLVRKTLPRSDGNGWRLQKFHDIRHLHKFVLLYGCLSNFDAGPGERHLKEGVKKQAKTALKSGGTTFLKSVSERIDETTLMRRVRVGMESRGLYETAHLNKKTQSVATTPPKNSTHTVNLPRSPAFIIELSASCDVISVKHADQSRERSANYKPSTRVISAICEEAESQYGDVHDEDRIVYLWTEATIRGTKYRCNPDFRNDTFNRIGTPWYDWANVAYEYPSDEGTTTELFPSKILGFVTFASSSNSVQVITMSTTFREVTEDSYGNPVGVLDSRLVGVWDKHYEPVGTQRSRGKQLARPQVYFLPPESIGEPIFVVEENGPDVDDVVDLERMSKRIVVIADPEKSWPLVFEDTV